MLLSNLRAERNFLLPVFRLPPETLAIIFTHGARDYYENEDNGCFTRYVPTWVNVSYVCSHWRNIALSCPILWTYLFNTSPRWTEELLLRSKEALLKISCFYQCTPYQETCLFQCLVNNLLKRSERIQELLLDIPLSFLPAGVSLCLPRIEKLHINLRCSDPDQSIAITNGDKHRLRTLKLVDCSLPWHSLNLSGLKTLCLRRVHSPSPLDTVEFLSVLSNMQNLTHLRLEEALPSARRFLSSGALDRSPKISLPRLALMVVIAPLSTVGALLSYVNIPRRARLTLEPLFEPGSTVGDYAPMSSFLARQFNQRSSGPIFRSLYLNACFVGSLFLSLAYESPLLEKVGCNIPLRIFLGGVQDEDTEEMELSRSDAQRIMSDICCSLPLTNIQSLHVLHPWELPSNIWKGMLGRMDSLRYMQLSYGLLPDLSLLFLATRESDKNPGGQPIPDQDVTSGHKFVPALEELELYRITFVPDHTPLRSGMSQTSFLDALSTRKGLQERVAMTSCRSSDDDFSP